jgi:hypothetical protein
MLGIAAFGLTRRHARCGRTSSCYQSFRVDFVLFDSPPSRFDRARKLQCTPCHPEDDKTQQRGRQRSGRHMQRHDLPLFAFEDQIGAYLLLQMLMGEALPGSDDSTGSRLQTQTKALRWSIDDLLATSDPGLSTQRQLAVSCKSSHQVTASGLPKDFILAAWDQWSRQRAR